MYYYRKSTKNDYEDDIRNLNNKIDIIYNLLENIAKDRNDLLILFNSRINTNIPDENIFHNDVYVDSDNRFKLIFICNSEPSDIYKYIFHIFIKSDFNNINLKFMINNKDFSYNIFVDKLKYLKIGEKFIFNKVVVGSMLSILQSFSFQPSFTNSLTLHNKEYLTVCLAIC